MLTEICGYLKNWFNRRPDGTDYPKYKGEFTIKRGVIKFSDGTDLDLLDGQYMRILGSIFNNGVFCYSSTPVLGENSAQAPLLMDETFTGEVWSMAIPVDVLALDKDVNEWMAINGKATSAALSPFNSESFGGYSYSKSGGRGGSSGGNQTGVTWMDVFGSRLSRYKKL